MPIADEALGLALRLALVGLIYLFLARVVAALLADLHATGQPGVPVLRLVPVEGAGARNLTIKGRASIGRGPNTDVVIPDPYISAEHAIVYWRDGAWWIADTGSTNGTFHNGRSVAAESPIGEGDEIQLGGVTFRVASTAAAGGSA